MKDVVPFEGLHCANCNTPLQGEYCFHCGQSVHSVLKPVHNMLEETLETVLHIDGRILHTLPPLMCKPGFLTLEYFSGRRMRYIAPFRLMFVSCLLAFFVLRIWSSSFFEQDIVFKTADSAISTAKTPADVMEQLNGALSGMEMGRPFASTSVRTKIDQSEAGFRLKAYDRLIALGETPAAASSAVGASSTFTKEAINGRDETLNKLNAPTTFQIAWLPNFVNAHLDRDIDHAKALTRLVLSPVAADRQEGMERLKTNIFAVLPQTMFVMIPAFALLLKLFYVFRRRLYMEHLIVALHSHAFLFLALIVMVLAGAVGSWLMPHVSWIAHHFQWLGWAIFIWALVYLFLMQKRVYRQSWPITLVKYLAIGWCYAWMLLWALIFAVVLGVTH